MTYPVPGNLPEAPLSLTFRIPEFPGEPLMTIRAHQGAEFEALSMDVARVGVQVGKSLTEYRAGFLAGAGIQSETPQTPNQAPSYTAPAGGPAAQMPGQGYQPPQGAYPQTGGAPAERHDCPHGPRVYKEFISKAGKPCKMWACQQPQNQGQCEPEWIR